MLTIEHNGRVEALTHVTGYQRRRQLNGELSLSFGSLDVPGNPGHALLQEDAVITTADGYEFRVLQVRTIRGRKDIDAISTFFDLGGVIKHEIFGGTKTLKAFVDWVLDGTGWTAEVVDVTQSQLVANFGNGSNALELIEQLLGAFECERQILPGKRIRFAKQIGPRRDKQFRYGHNVQALTHQVDMSDVRVKITGYGGGNLKVTYTSPNAARFPDAGEAEPFKDDRFTQAASMMEQLKQELKDTPDIIIEVDTLEVGDVEEGETVWLIYEPLGIELETRVIGDISTDPERPKWGTVTLGNATPKRIEDRLTETDIRLDEANETIEENRRQSETSFEQTNERITQAAEALEEYTDERFGEVVREMDAKFEVTAESITGAVRESMDYTDSRELILKDALEAAENRWQGDLSPIGERVTDLEGNVSTIVDDLGTLDSDLATLRGDVVSVREEYDSKFEQVSNRITLEVNGMKEYTETQAGVAQSNAQTYAEGLVTPISESLGSLNTEVSELDQYIDGAFKDNLVNLSERKVIANMLKDLSLEKAGADSQYNSLYNNAFLPADKKGPLQSSKTAFDSAYSDLTSTIERVIRDGLVFPHESEEVDAAFTFYRSAYSAFYKAVEDAGSHVAEKFAGDAEGRAKEFTNQEISKVNTAIGGVSESLSQLDEYVDGAFRDGIVQTTEARAIAKHINDLKAQKADLDSRYNTVHNDPNLLDKVALEDAKADYNSAHSALVQAINSAIADGKATEAESQAVDQAFSAYQSALSSLSDQVAAAGRSIAAKLAADAQFNAKEYTDNELTKTNTIVERLEESVEQLDGYIDASFRDGIVQEAEAKGIRNHLNTLATNKTSIDERYNTLVNNPKLSPSVKSSLQTAKSDFNTQYANLVDQINDAIADGKATTQESQAVDAAFTAYQGAVGELTAQMEDATVSIADRLATDAREAAMEYMDEELVVLRTEASSDFNLLSGRINAKADATTVTNLGSRTTSLESDMNALTGEISQTVKYTDYTGQSIISKISQTASNYKISAKNIELDGITRTSGTLEIGGGSGGLFSELRFPNSQYGYAANIKAEVYGGFSGLSINTSYLDLRVGNRLELGTASSTGSGSDGTYARGYWNFSNANVTGITATAVLG